MTEGKRRVPLFERPPDNVYVIPNADIDLSRIDWMSDYDASDPNAWHAPYCPTCDRYLCRKVPMHDVIYSGDPRHPKYTAP